MYCHRHRDRRLALAAQTFAPDFLALGIRDWQPVRYSPSDCAQFDLDLRNQNKYLYDNSGNPSGTQNLNADDCLRMLNDRILMMCDAAYAVTRYCFVSNEEGVIQRFKFRVAQHILFEIISDLENLDIAIEIMILKGRQLGMTTLVEILIMLRIVFSRGANYVIASADRRKSALMAGKLFMAYDMLPVWARPSYTSRVQSDQGGKMEFGSMHSRVTIEHGNQASGISRGGTPLGYHLSECASFINPEELIDASLFKCVHPSPAVFGILESTGEGDQGWWADTWRYSKLNWDSHRARLCPLFLPWFCGVDIYPKPAWLRARPIPPKFMERRLPDTKEHVAKAQAYVATHPVIAKHLCIPHPDLPDRSHWWVDGKMPIEQQWFWEVGHEEAKANGNEGIWYQEMCGDDIEALQRSSESVFGYEVMEQVEQSRQRSYHVYGLAGQSIESAHECDPADIDYQQDRVRVRWLSSKGDSYGWELIPLHHEEDYLDRELRNNPDAFWDYAHGKLFVFHPPQPGVDYSIGVDTSNGLGQDSTVISVTALGQRGAPDVQAAEFRSAYVSHVEAYAFVGCIAAYYARHMKDSNLPHDHPLIGIEQVQAVGDTCQLQLRRSFGFTRFPGMIRYDSKKIRKGRATKLGWYTFGWSRPLLTDGFVHCIQNGWYVPNSPWLLHEMHHYEVHYTAAGKEKKEHEEGQHDDGIMAAAISLMVARDLQAMTERSKHRYMGTDGGQSLPPVDLAPFTGYRMSTKSEPLASIDDLL